MRKEQGNKQQVSEDLLGLAEVAIGRDIPEKAAILLGAVGAVLNEDIHFDLPGQHALDRTTAAVRSKLGDVEYTKAYSEGYSMTIDEAVEYALRSL